jgi:HAD superfamily hydrolase (TIGR01509 family)
MLGGVIAEASPFSGLSAVIFDLDGLCLDTEPTYAHAWKRAAAEFGVELSDAYLHGLFGYQASDVEQALAWKIGAAFEPERFRDLAAGFWRAHVESQGIAAMPGLEELLAALARLGLPHALATNGEGSFALECLRLGKLENRFAAIVTRDQVQAGKPAPDLYLEAARRLGVAPAACLVLEDSLVGLEAARAAGMRPALVTRRAAPAAASELADAIFSSLSEVAERFDGL